MARLILDTGVLIAGVRNKLSPTAFMDSDDIGIPAVVIAEYLTGLKLSSNTDEQTRQRDFLYHIIASAPVIDYTIAIAEHHADLLAHVKRTGAPRGPHDLIIAATARATGRVLLTTDEKANFADLPGLQVRLITAT